MSGYESTFYLRLKIEKENPLTNILNAIESILKRFVGCLGNLIPITPSLLQRFYER
jgi:hypothetical protein